MERLPRNLQSFQGTGNARSTAGVQYLEVGRFPGEIDQGGKAKFSTGVVCVLPRRCCQRVLYVHCLHLLYQQNVLKNLLSTISPPRIRRNPTSTSSRKRFLL